MADLFQRLSLPIVALVLLSIAAAALLVYLKYPGSAEIVEIPMPSASPTPDKEIKVYVSGAVVMPGVYRLLTSNRIEDAVKAAGGMTAEANPDAINLATKVRDEMHVYVPKRGEPSAGAEASGTSPRTSINTATAEQLESLPGIGEVTAKRIVDYRTKNGPFKSVEELRDLKLVNASTFDKIKDLVVP